MAWIQCLPVLEFEGISDDTSEKVVVALKISSSTNAGIVILEFCTVLLTMKISKHKLLQATLAEWWIFEANLKQAFSYPMPVGELNK